jgi:hypothetical protein
VTRLSPAHGQAGALLAGTTEDRDVHGRSLLTEEILTEEIAGGIAQQGLGAFLARRQRQAAHQRGRDAVELAHYRLGAPASSSAMARIVACSGRPAGSRSPEVALDGGEAGHADGDVDQPLAPRPAEGVGDDHVTSPPTSVRRLSRIPRAERSESSAAGDHVGVDVGLIDAGVGAHPAVARLGHQHAAVHAHDARDSRRMTSIRRGSRPSSAAKVVAISEGVISLSLSSRPSDFDTIFWLSTSTSAAASGVRWRAAASTTMRATSSPGPDLADALDADDLVAGRHRQRRATGAGRDQALGDLPAASSAALGDFALREQHAQILRRVDVEGQPRLAARS